MKEASTPGQKKLSVFTLTMITGAMIVSARNLPMMAEAGLHVIFFMLIAALCFFAPVALVSAELATGWPKQGGVYSWVKEAFGERWGFVAIWLQWSMMTFLMLTVLDFIGGALAFVFKPELAQNRFFLYLVILVVYWGATLSTSAA